MLRDFKEKLKGNYDVIIIGQAPIKDFPPEIIEDAAGQGEGRHRHHQV